MQQHIRSRDAAEKIGVSDATLRAWRRNGTGPKHIKLGDSRRAPVVYEVAELERWLAIRAAVTSANRAARAAA